MYVCIKTVSKAKKDFYLFVITSPFWGINGIISALEIEKGVKGEVHLLKMKFVL